MTRFARPSFIPGTGSGRAINDSIIPTTEQRQRRSASVAVFLTEKTALAPFSPQRSFPPFCADTAVSFLKAGFWPFSFSKFFPSLHIDGWLGILVACFVLKAGLDIFKDTLSSLIGQPPSKELVDEIKNKILTYDHVSGIHDLIVHNYGPEHYFATVHVEIPTDIDVMVGHDIIDNIENDIKKEIGIDLTIHYDPIVVNDERVNELKEMTDNIVKNINPELSIHDFRVVDGPMHTNLIFDVVIPYGFKEVPNEIIKEISLKISEVNDSYFTVIKAEHSFV